MAPRQRRVDAALRSQLRRNLSSFEPRSDAREGLRPAAVCIAITEDEGGEPAFLITRRPTTLRRHSGQWALPGGRLDPGESPLEAGLRELDEELGIALGPDSLLGELDVYETRSGFAMTPLVLWAGSVCEVRPDPNEVASWHYVPFHELEKPEVPQLHRIPESDRPVIVVPIIGAQINAPTAAILFQFVEVAIRGRDTRVAHYEQPVFAWK
jgi:8-oxo-dGTP pyrophosphatase MutT (NUDIX family)